MAATFKVEKTKDFTVMCNYHLRDKRLSLKTVGLLSVMLSLPDTWDYTIKGLSCIVSGGIDMIRVSLLELEQNGYLERCRRRDDHGRLQDTEYIIYERPQERDGAPPDGTGNKPKKPVVTPKPPILDFPILDKPILENPTQLNIEEVNTEISNTDNSLNTHQGLNSLNTEILNAEKSINRPSVSDRLRRDKAEAVVRENIGYEELITHYDRAQIDNITALMAEVITCKSDYIRFGKKNSIPAHLVRECFLHIGMAHVEYVLECIAETAGPIRNIWAYILTALYRAPQTYDLHKAMSVRPAPDKKRPHSSYENINFDEIIANGAIH